MQEMQRIREVQLAELMQAPQCSGETSLSVISGQRLPSGSAVQLATLMEQVQSLHPNQSLPEGTPEMYMAAWERMALQYGMRRFEAGLLRAIDATHGKGFFPSHYDIADACEVLRVDEANTTGTQRNKHMIEDAKTTYVREYLEDVAQGVERRPLSPELQPLADRIKREQATTVKTYAYV